MHDNINSSSAGDTSALISASKYTDCFNSCMPNNTIAYIVSNTNATFVLIIVCGNPSTVLILNL